VKLRGTRKEVELIILNENFSNLNDSKLKNVVDFYLVQKNQAETEPATQRIVSQPLGSLTEKERELSEKLGREVVYCESFLELFKLCQVSSNLKDFMAGLVDINKVFFEEEKLENNPRILQIMREPDNKDEPLPSTAKADESNSDLPFKNREQLPFIPKYSASDINTPHDISDEYQAVVNTENNLHKSPTPNNAQKKRENDINSYPVHAKEKEYQRAMDTPHKEVSYNFNLPNDLKIQKRQEYDYDDFSHENIRDEYPQLVGKAIPHRNDNREKKHVPKIITPAKVMHRYVSQEADSQEFDPKIEQLIRENEILAKELEEMESNKREMEQRLNSQRERSKYDRNKSKILVMQNFDHNLKPHEGTGFYNILKSKDDNIEKLQTKIVQLENEFKRFAPKHYIQNTEANDDQSRLSTEMKRFGTPIAKSKGIAVHRSNHKFRLLESENKDISNRFDSSGTVFVNQMLHNINKLLDKPAHRSQREYHYDLYDL